LVKFARTSPERTGTAIVPPRNEVPLGTLRSILNQAHIDPESWDKHLIHADQDLQTRWRLFDILPLPKRTPLRNFGAGVRVEQHGREDDQIAEQYGADRLPPVHAARDEAGGRLCRARHNRPISAHYPGVVSLLASERILGVAHKCNHIA
jgi:hypothetical protein